MNALENWFCSSTLWRWMTQRKLLPWLLSGVELGDHVLELGSGPGAGTDELLRRAPRVTCLEYSHAFATNLAARFRDSDRQSPQATSVLQGDAAALPFSSASFSTVTAVLMLHHLRSPDLQARAFCEIHRVLRPGGVFVLFEILDSWFNRIIHYKSSFVPISPDSVVPQLTGLGFSQIILDRRNGAFRLRAIRPQ